MGMSYEFTVEIIEDTGHYVKIKNPDPFLTHSKSVFFFEYLYSLGFRFIQGNEHSLVCEKLQK